jgi:acyl-coenzyme A thioesterase PaaI-like protein
VASTAPSGTQASSTTSTTEITTVTSTTVAPISSGLAGEYTVTLGTVGTAAIHQSGSAFTISSTSTFTLENAKCALPVGTVLATFSGAGPSYVSNAFAFDPITCNPNGSAAGGTASASSDGSFTLLGPTGTHLFVKSANAHLVASPAAAGNYTVVFGASRGTAAVHQSASTVTISTTGPLTIERATCALKSGTVLATLSGAGPSYVSTAFAFDAATCNPNGSAAGGTAYLNSDNTISLLGPTGWHLLTPA